MKKIALYLTCALLAFTSANAQQRVVDEVKKDIGSLSPSVKTYQDALAKIRGALSNDETKNHAEAWYVAGQAGYGVYDKSDGEKAIGRAVDQNAANAALLEGEGYMWKALELDSVKEINKDGTFKTNKDGTFKIKTKYSKDIINKIIGHVGDIAAVAADFHNAKNWENAYKSWGYYIRTMSLPQAKGLGLEFPDTTKGQFCFYQGICANQLERLDESKQLFIQAKDLGYDKPEVYECILAVTQAQKDTLGEVAIAREAYAKFGNSQPLYMRTLINYYLQAKKYDEAKELLDKAIAANAGDYEAQNLLGLVVEQQSGMEAALPYYKKAIETNPDYADGLFDVGRYYYNKALDIVEKNPDLNTKQLSAKVDPDYKEAEHYFEQALQIGLKDFDRETNAKNALKRIYYQLGESDKLDALDKETK